MKKMTRALKIGRDTIRNLSNHALGRVIGGGAGNTVGDCPSAATCFAPCATTLCGPPDGGGGTGFCTRDAGCTIEVA